jgi:hypothetical protein
MQEKDIHPQFILAAIRERIDSIVQEEVAEAQKRVVDRVAQEAAAISVTIMKQISISGFGDELVIRIDAKGRK